jgi:hypothetical protein
MDRSLPEISPRLPRAFFWRSARSPEQCLEGGFLLVRHWEGGVRTVNCFSLITFLFSSRDPLIVPGPPWRSRPLAEWPLPFLGVCFATTPHGTSRGKSLLISGSEKDFWHPGERRIREASQRLDSLKSRHEDPGKWIPRKKILVIPPRSRYNCQHSRSR